MEPSKISISPIDLPSKRLSFNNKHRSITFWCSSLYLGEILDEGSDLLTLSNQLGGLPGLTAILQLSAIFSTVVLAVLVHLVFALDRLLPVAVLVLRLDASSRSLDILQ